MKQNHDCINTIDSKLSGSPLKPILFICRVFCCLFIICHLCTTIGFAQFPGGGMPTGGIGSGSGGKVAIDDTTKQVYGPKTAQFFTEEDILNNRKTLYMSDTSYFDIHRYSYIQRSNHHFTDLGNLGTAIRSVFVKTPESLGAQLGYDAFNQYQYALQDVKYYDTKSPFTDMYLVLGGNGQNILRFNHTQNINPQLNIGFNAQRMTTDKRYGTSGQADAQTNLTQNWSFVLHSNYRSQDDKYTLLAQINTLNQNNYEQGGIVPDSSKLATTGKVIFFEVVDPPARLTNASTWYRNNRLHVYQQYKMAQGFQLYHTFDYRREKDIYYDLKLGDSQKYGVYPKSPFNIQKLNHDVRFRVVENVFGIKGRYQLFNYRLYYRSRIWGMVGSGRISDSTYNEYKLSKIENYAGLWLSYFLKDSTQRVTAEVELGNGIKIKGELVTRWFSAGYTSILTPPTITQQLFQSSHLNWKNSFNNINTNHIYGQLNLHWKKWFLGPRLDYHLLNNFVYYGSNAKPIQANAAFSVLRIGGIAEWQNKRFGFRNETYFTVVSNKDFLRVPPFFQNLRTSYHFAYPRKTKVLLIQAGIDLHYQSAYFADGYMPLTQQFHIQNTYQSEGYPLIDLFANFRINRVRMFVKVSNATDRLPLSDYFNGYFVSPLYTAMGRSIAFGVIWPLFD